MQRDGTHPWRTSEFIRAVLAVHLAITLPIERYAPLVRHAAAVMPSRAVGRAGFCICAELERGRTSAFKTRPTRTDQTQMRTAAIVQTTRIRTSRLQTVMVNTERKH